ncbi:MAG: hypothetical protein JWQ25_1011 [Daejeonella sp.]|nr:hypothetical protein [Daejeonella sp.]
MVKAEYRDKPIVVDILSKAFDKNLSVNYIVKQDEQRLKRIEALMGYSFEVCRLFGDVFISEDRNACALVLFPEKKKTTFKSIILDFKLIRECIGLSNLMKAFKREAKVKDIQPKQLMYYLWFLGVNPSSQNTGIGATLLKQIIQDSIQKQRSIFLETSTISNLPWYEKFGFKIYHELNLNYKLFFLKREFV